MCTGESHLTGGRGRVRPERPVTRPLYESEAKTSKRGRNRSKGSPSGLAIPSGCWEGAANPSRFFARRSRPRPHFHSLSFLQCGLLRSLLLPWRLRLLSQTVTRLLASQLLPCAVAVAWLKRSAASLAVSSVPHPLVTCRLRTSSPRKPRCRAAPSTFAAARMRRRGPATCIRSLAPAAAFGAAELHTPRPLGFNPRTRLPSWC